MSNFEVHEVKGDGACLYRSLSNGLFHLLDKDLNKVKQIFKKSKYFRNGSFLNEYLDIVECFQHDDYVLDDDIEDEIAIELQKLIFYFIKHNKNFNISKYLPSYSEISTNIEKLILLCHNLSYEEYLETYCIWAGEDYNKERWGGIPELVIFCILFKVSITIYIPQIIENGKIKETQNVNLENIYLMKVDKINPDTNKDICLILRTNGESAHYDYIKKLI